MDDSNALIRSFRNDVDFRIAVTVTLVATGTDVRPLEVLIFLNDVHSEPLYTQMRGRGVRTISPSALQAVTPNAISKDLFFLIDAVGVTESEKFVPTPGEDDEPRPLNPSLEQLFEKISLGVVPDDYLQLLASKLSCIGNRADPEDMQEYFKICSVGPLEFAQRIFDTLDEGKLPPYISSQHDNSERLSFISDLICNTPAKRKLVEIAKGYVKEIRNKTDEVLEARFSHEEAQASTQAFKTYVQAHKDDIEALRLIYNQDVGKLTREMIDGLGKNIAEAIPGFSVSRQWNDFKLIDPEHVTVLKKGSDAEAITNLIQLVRFAYGMISTLYSLTSVAAQRFELWCGQRQRTIPMNEEQKELFRKIAIYISQNGCCNFDRLRFVMQEITNDLIRFLRSRNAANEQIISLNEFILKAA